ncbi:Uncharacterised protein [Acinetobacter baumannii]|nr:Uncharacterised protein [Acinetobacter baumannii]
MLQGGKQGRALIFGAGGQQLQHQEILEAIDSDARQAVGFAGDQAVSVQAVALRDPITPALRLLQAANEEIDVNLFILLESPDACADLRLGRIGAARQPLALAVENIDGFTGEGFTLNALNGAGEHPRVATE